MVLLDWVPALNRDATSETVGSSKYAAIHTGGVVYNIPYTIIFVLSFFYFYFTSFVCWPTGLLISIVTAQAQHRLSSVRPTHPSRS